MQRSTIMQRLVLLTAIPVLALILFSGELIWESYGRYQSAIQAKSIMEIAVATGDLIHPLQIERGASAGLIQSKGQKFADTLPGIRAKTDEKLSAYKHLLAGIGAGAMPKLKAAVDDAEAKLAGLAELR
ncbi:MAG: nitrate- and nitrite sensing domain-containing protein, partial [Pseudomonadota bacterium]